jgi:AraC family transcriptional regulator
MEMKPKFVTKPAFTVVGLRIRTKPMSPDIPALWDQFVPRMDEIENPSEPYVSYGVMGNYTADGFDYMAGNPVEDATHLPEGMVSWDVSANTYAVFDATLSNVGQVFNDIYNTWLPSSEYQPVDGFTLERYGEDFSPDTPNFTVYVPVQKKK